MIEEGEEEVARWELRRGRMQAGSSAGRGRMSREDIVGSVERTGQEVEMAVSRSWAEFRSRMSGVETNKYFGSDPNLGTPRFSTARPA